MKDAILKYSEKVKAKLNWYTEHDLTNACKDLKDFFDKGIYFIERTNKTDFSKFAEEFGFELPNDIKEYINLFYHPYIIGFYKLEECIILFSVIKFDNESENDVLFHENGVIKLAREWHSVFGGNIKKYLPIGWLEYSGRYILYDIKTGKIYEEDFDQEGIPSDEPLANSFKDLIGNLELVPNKKED